MAIDLSCSLNLWRNNRRAFLLWGGLVLLAWTALVGYHAFEGKWLRLGLLVLAPGMLLVISLPRVAFVQYVLVLFVNMMVVPSAAIILIDISAMILVLAALMDVLLHEQEAPRFPPLFGYFVALFAALFVCGIFGHNILISARSTARIAALAVTLLALLRLGRYFSLTDLVRLYFWVAVANGLVALVPFVASGGQMRSFGFAPALLDDLLALALPIGASLFLWGRRKRALAYAAGCLIVFGALAATQSRASILIALLFSVFVFIVSWRRSRTLADGDPGPRDIRRRVLLTMVFGGSALIVLVAVFSGFFETLLWRFERLFSTTPRDTILARFALWKYAWLSFLSNPITGIGPGNFRYVQQIFHQATLDPIYFYVRGYSAHNLTIHYLAETGIVGTSALIALFVRQFSLARRGWRNLMSPDQVPAKLALLTVSGLFLLTTFVEAGWMWAATGHIFVFFAAAIVRGASE
jgi:O-antigen ligase